jgi:hypothetical protein
MGVHAQFALANRVEIENEIERLIALLDLADGDWDAEDDDPAGDPLDERGEEPASCGRELLTMMPIYGSDQTRGPINKEAALQLRDRQRMAG